MIAGWAFIALIVDPAIRAPAPWTQLVGGIFLAGLWVFITLKVPLFVSVGRNRIQFRLLLWNRTVLLSDVTDVEYRTQLTGLGRPMDERDYAITLRRGTKRLADVGIDGHIASRLMSVLDPSLSIERIYRGRQLVEERPLAPRR